MKRINETFSVTLLLFHLIVLVSMCMEMYRASSVSEWRVLLKPMAYTLMGLFAFTICYCAYSQTLIDEVRYEACNLANIDEKLSIRKSMETIQ
nr:unnamed protein product [Callosobruchus analis]